MILERRAFTGWMKKIVGRPRGIQHFTSTHYPLTQSQSKLGVVLTSPQFLLRKQTTCSLHTLFTSNSAFALTQGLGAAHFEKPASAVKRLFCACAAPEAAPPQLQWRQTVELTGVTSSHTRMAPNSATGPEPDGLIGHKSQAERMVQHSCAISAACARSDCDDVEVHGLWLFYREIPRKGNRVFGPDKKSYA